MDDSREQTSRALFSRRRFLGTSAAVLVFPSTVTGQTAQSGPLARALENPPQFIAIADTNHRDLSIPAAVASPTTIAVLAAAGTKHLFIERSASMQPLADAVAAGTLSRDDFITQMTNKYHLNFQKKPEEIRLAHSITFDMITNAKAKGIKVHYIDSQTYAVRRTPEAIAWREAFDRYVIEQAKQDNINYAALNEKDKISYRINSFCKFLTGKPKEFLQRLEQVVLNERLASDGDIAANIKKIAGTDRAAIFYGGEHDRHQGVNFVSYLGEANVRKLALFGRDTSMAARYSVASGWIALLARPLPNMHTPSSPPLPSVPAHGNLAPACQALLHPH